MPDDALTHDASGRLTDECGPQVTTPTKCAHWTYDTNGNLLTATDDTGATDVYTYSAPGPGSQLNEQVAGGSSTSPPTATIALAYDAHGDTTSISNAVSQTPTDPGYNKYALAESFAYDAQQRPITLTRLVADKVNGQTIVTPLTATIQYNADGLRSDYLLTPDPRTGKQPVDTRFAYRDGQLASATVTDITGTLLYKNTFLYGPGGEPLELIRTNPDGTTSRYWYVLDGLGSVVALTSITGTVVDRYAYDSWGEETSNDAVNETVPQQLRYRGYYYDEKLTWYWVTTRYYDPEGMRWLQPDPSDLDGVRTYAYVGDDPIDAGDPSGLAWGCLQLGRRFKNGRYLGIYCKMYDIPPWARRHATNANAGHGVYMFLVGDDLNELGDPNYDPAHLAVKGLALVDLVSNVSLFIPFEGEADRIGAKAAFAAGKRFLVRKISAVGREDAERLIQRILRGCATCFPAGAQVATPNGSKAIESLHVGDHILAEDTQTGKVRPEPVQAVIRDPISPLIAVDLNNGSAITVTADHPFWVDAGPSLTKPEWVVAGELRSGDRLRTADGANMIVIGLRQNVGRAKVYTLTVAHDHTFFVGSGHVLVHNSTCEWPDNPKAMDQLLGFEGERIPDGTQYPGRNKVVWKLSNMRIVYEEHPYHVNAPDWHKGPHWHIDYPGTKHERHVPGEPF